MPTILDHMKFLLSAVGENEARKNLMVVKCYIKDEYIHMIAANGIIIKTVKKYLDGPHDYSKVTKEFYIDLESLKKILKIANKDSVYTFYNGAIQIDNVTVEFKKYELDYPDLSMLINAKVEAENKSFVVNQIMLLSAMKDSYTDNRKHNYNRIQFVKSKPDDPVYLIKIDFNNDEQYAYMMPVADNWGK